MEWQSSRHSTKVYLQSGWGTWGDSSQKTTKHSIRIKKIQGILTNTCFPFPSRLSFSLLKSGMVMWFILANEMWVELIHKLPMEVFNADAKFQTSLSHCLIIEAATDMKVQCQICRERRYLPKMHGLEWEILAFLAQIIWRLFSLQHKLT